MAQVREQGPQLRSQVSIVRLILRPASVDFFFFLKLFSPFFRYKAHCHCGVSCPSSRSGCPPDDDGLRVFAGRPVRSQLGARVERMLPLRHVSRHSRRDQSTRDPVQEGHGQVRSRFLRLARVLPNARQGMVRASPSPPHKTLYATTKALTTRHPLPLL